MGSLLASEGLAGLLARRENLVFNQEETLPSGLGSWALEWPAVTVVLELGCSWVGAGADVIDGVIRLVTGSVDLTGEAVDGSDVEADGDLGSGAAGVLSRASLVPGSTVMGSVGGLVFVPSLSTGAEKTR